MIKWFLLREPLDLSLGALFNHRGSSMNLRFQSTHRVATREVLSIKKIETEKIQEACNDQHKDE